MQYFTQMTLTGVEAVPEAAVSGGLSCERGLAVAARAIAKNGALAGITGRESNLLNETGPVDARFWN